MYLAASKAAVQPSMAESLGRPEFQPLIGLAEFSDLVGEIYRGVFQTPPWEHVVGQLRERLEANFAFLILRNPSAKEHGIQVMAAADHDTRVSSPEFWDGGYALDPFVNLPKNTVVTVDEMMGDAWQSGAFYKQFVAPSDIRYILGADIVSEDGIECHLRISRPPGSTDFSEADKALCQMLVPHLACALRFHAQFDSMECERSLFAGAVDRMLVGTIILDDRGQLLRMNSAAQGILAEKDGIEFVRGTLKTTYYADENRELQRLVTKAIASIATSAPSVLEAASVTRPSGRQKLGVLVRAIPIGEWSEGQHRPAVAVFIRDPERRAMASYEVARKLFELTPAEAALAMRVANGLSLDEAADELGIRKNTARAQLRAIFVKTGVTSQSALVRTMLNSVMYLE